MPLIPETLDIAGAIQSGIIAMGAIAGVAIGGYFAFLLIRLGVRWAGTAMDERIEYDRSSYEFRQFYDENGNRRAFQNDGSGWRVHNGDAEGWRDMRDGEWDEVHNGKWEEG